METKRERTSRKYRPDDPPEPGDEQVGQWNRERLEKMDQRFAKAIARAEREQAEQLPARSKGPTRSER